MAVSRHPSRNALTRSVPGLTLEVPSRICTLSCRVLLTLSSLKLNAAKYLGMLLGNPLGYARHCSVSVFSVKRMTKARAHEFQAKMSNVATGMSKRSGAEFWDRHEPANSCGKKQGKSFDDSGDLRTSSLPLWLRMLIQGRSSPLGDWA